MRGPDDAPGCCLCLPWPFLNNSSTTNSGATARQRADTRVAPVQGRVPLAVSAGSRQEDSMNTFRCPPRPLPYDDPRFSHQTEHHPLVSEHEKASTQFQKPNQLGESKNVDTTSTCTADKTDGSSVKTQSGAGPKIGGTQLYVPSDSEEDCPICLEEYDYENPKIALECNHSYHLGCIYEWMERSQSCPVCAKVMLFNEGQ